MDLPFFPVRTLIRVGWPGPAGQALSRNRTQATAPGRCGTAKRRGRVVDCQCPQRPEGAENLVHLGRCVGTPSVQPHLAVGAVRARRPCDDLRLVGLKLIFLIVTRSVSLLGLSRREVWWKDAEILILRHQLAVTQRERPRAHTRLTWPDRAWVALLAGTLPIERLAATRLIVTPATMVR
jgi:hypothetical protein